MKFPIIVTFITFGLLIAHAHAALASKINDNELSVYGDVPGLDPSPFYQMKLKKEGSERYLHPFTFVTECTTEKYCNTTNFFNHLGNWSNSYINFEMQDGVDVEIVITKLFGDPIQKAVVHPKSASKNCIVKNGKAYVTINKTGLFTVDINGQMDDQDTGRLPKTKGYYQGPPIHTLTIFANPFLVNKPSLTDEAGVYKVIPGEFQFIPHDGSWNTLYFLPGIHDIGVGFPVHSNKTYYIPGDSVVYGTFHNDDPSDGDHILIYGHGTLSGDRLPHPNYADPSIPDNWFKSIYIQGAMNTSVEGITIANSAFHSLQLQGKYDPESPADVNWVKIFTWRANGDGIDPLGNTKIENCFIRTQDDSSYISGRGIKSVIYWNDSNGSTFVLSHIGGFDLNSHPLVIEDCTVVYARAYWHHWSGGNIFNMRGKGGGSGGYTITFKNIVVEDPRPTLQPFKILMEGLQPYSDPEEERRGPGDLYGLVFQNISIAAPSVLGEPDILWGMSDGLIYDLIFDNVVIGNETIKNIDHFYHNEFVFN